MLSDYAGCVKPSSIVFMPVGDRRLISPDRISINKEDTAKQNTYCFWFGGGCEVWSWLDQVRMIGCFKGRVRRHLHKQKVVVFIESKSVSNLLRLISHAVTYCILWQLLGSHFVFQHHFKYLPKISLKCLQKISSFLNLEWECKKNVDSVFPVEPHLD